MSTTLTAWDPDRMSQAEQDTYFGRTYVAHLRGARHDGRLVVWDDTPTTPTEVEVEADVRPGVGLGHLDASLQALGWKRLEDWTVELDADAGLHLAAAVQRLEAIPAVRGPRASTDQQRHSLVHGPRL